MMNRRNFLLLGASLPLTGCAYVLVGGGIAAVSVYKKEEIIQLYCNLISCTNGEAKLSELSEVVYWEVVKAASQARKEGNSIYKKDIDQRYKKELLIAKKALRDSGIRIVNDFE